MAKLKKELRDINRVPADGYLIFPLSMGRLSNAQSAKKCHDALKFFEKKLEKISLDVIFLYTNGLYSSSNESALEVRKRTTGQMLAHKGAIMNLILKEKKYVPQAMHFLPWDYIVLNTPKFDEFYGKLKKLGKEDKEFYKILLESLNGREETEANINFLIEEIVVTHIIRQKLVELPKTLVKNDNFRLFVYPGKYLKGDLYQWKNKILSQSKESHFYASHYDLNKKVLYNFDELN